MSRLLRFWRCLCHARQVDKALPVFQKARALRLGGHTSAQATLDKIRQLDGDADLSGDDAPRAVVLTVPSDAVQPVASSGSLVADVALLIEFDLLEHAQSGSNDSGGLCARWKPGKVFRGV